MDTYRHSDPMAGRFPFDFEQRRKNQIDHYQRSRNFYWTSRTLYRCHYPCVLPSDSTNLNENHGAEPVARANDPICHALCSEQHRPRQTGSRLILNVSQNGNADPKKITFRAKRNRVRSNHNLRHIMPPANRTSYGPMLVFIRYKNRKKIRIL